jgi:hypothetical protein
MLLAANPVLHVNKKGRNLESTGVKPVYGIPRIPGEYKLNPALRSGHAVARLAPCENGDQVVDRP